jgi:hypothetical protein
METMKARGYALDDLSLDGVNFNRAVWQASLVRANALSDRFMDGLTDDGLLCATAEVLGNSSYGTVYKAAFEDGAEVTVKRLREGVVRSQREFEADVNTLGKVRHANLLPLRGYKKLLIFDFLLGGSLSAFLHGKYKWLDSE